MGGSSIGTKFQGQPSTNCAGSLAPEPSSSLAFEELDALFPSPPVPLDVVAPSLRHAAQAASPQPPAPRPKRTIPTGVRFLVDSGVSLRECVSKTHKMALSELHQFCNDYVAYVRTKPALREHLQVALEQRAEVFSQRHAADASEAVAELELEIGKLRAQDTVKLLQVRTPDPVRMHQMISEVVFPVADTADFLIKFVPIVGQVVAATEAATGRMYMGLGEELAPEWRVVDGALTIVPLLGPIARGGAKGARTVVEIAARTNRSTSEVLRSMERLMALEPHLPALRAATGKVARGEALSSLEMQAYRRATNIIDDLRGTAQHTRFRGDNLVGKVVDPDKLTYGTWRKNPPGVAPRDMEGVRRVLSEQGIEMPDWVRVVREDKIADRVAVQESVAGGKARSTVEAESDTFADYPFSQQAERKALSGQKLTFDDLLEPDGTLIVRVRSDVFESDEAIVAVLSHELHELRNLERVFDEVGTMSAKDIRAWTHPGRGQNLHGQAWDVADLRVLLMRAESPSERAAIGARLEAMLERFERQNFQ